MAYIKKRKKKSRAGRHTVMTAEVIAKLEFASARGCNITEACLYADISADSYYRYLKKHPEFASKIEILRDKPAMQARLNIADGIYSGDVDISKWYLERKRKDEFSPRVDQTIEGKDNANPIPITFTLDLGDKK